MSFIRIYLRVLGLLASDARLALTLAVANIALAISQFIEPVLFGRIVDALSGALPEASQPAARMLAPLVGAWVGFGLFIIVAARWSPGSPTGWRIAAATWCWRIISNTSCSCRWPIIPAPIPAAR